MLRRPRAAAALDRPGWHEPSILWPKCHSSPQTSESTRLHVALSWHISKSHNSIANRLAPGGDSKRKTPTGGGGPCACTAKTGRKSAGTEREFGSEGFVAKTPVEIQTGVSIGHVNNGCINCSTVSKNDCARVIGEYIVPDSKQSIIGCFHCQLHCVIEHSCPEKKRS